MKFFTWFFVPFFTICYGQKDRRDSVRTIITLEFMQKGADSLLVSSMFDSLNKKFKVKHIYFAKNKTGSSHFLPGKVMLVNVDTDINSNFLSAYDEWIGELAHAQQFSEKPFRYSWMAFVGFWQTFCKLVSHHRTYKMEADELIKDRGCGRIKAYLWTAYQDQYEDEGSFEYEAHKVREIKLRNYFLMKVVTHSVTVR